MKMKTHILRTHFAILLGLTFLTTTICQAARPNVVIVITDDQGYGDVSFHGNPVLKTPNLDQLAKQSLRLTNYHVAPTCSPTRSAIQTGHWQNRTGVWHTILGRSLLRDDEVTMGQVFKNAGYATGMLGKWHLGDNYPYRPEDRGYTEVMRHGGGGVGQTPDFWDNAYFDGSYFHNSKPTPVKGFCTDVWFDYAKRFIKSQKDAGKPFLAYIATNAPHGPMHAPKKFSEPYSKYNVNTANFLGMIANIDDNVGKLRAFLDEQGLTENTIFIFTTDNGTAGGDRIFNAGMRGKKGSEFDGGHRVPFFIHWPAGKLNGGTDVPTITAHVDVFPTLLDLCGVAAPKGVKFDGRSVRPLLEGSASLKDGSWPDRILVTDSQRVRNPQKWRKSAVMTNRWRLINGKQLFDMQNDPSQKKDVADDHPKVVTRLQKFYEEWWAELLPTFKVDCPIYLGHPGENPAALTSHDWITDGATPWNHSHIRSAAKGPRVTGFWNVRVVESGTYEIRLRRWPVESNAAIDAGLPPGDNVPGVAPYRARAGKAIPVQSAFVEIGGQKVQVDVAPGAKEAVLQLKLKRGLGRLTARFVTKNEEVVGAYYAYVKKIRDD